MKADLDFPGMITYFWQPLKSAPRSEDIWILGLTTHKKIVFCHFILDKDWHGRKWGWGHDNVRYNLVGWQPLRLPEPTYRRLRWWQKAINWLLR